MWTTPYRLSADPIRGYRPLVAGTKQGFEEPDLAGGLRPVARCRSAHSLHLLFRVLLRDFDETALRLREAKSFKNGITFLAYSPA